jgi:hypothetical protein
MNKKNIASLGSRLQQLGFPPGITERLAAYCCFEPASFEIPYRLSDNGLSCTFHVHCMKGELGMYDAVFFTGTLRKDAAVPADCEEFDKEMGVVDWVGLAAARDSEAGVVDLVGQADRAYRLLSELVVKDVSGLIRYRHWVGTALEDLVPNLAVHKNNYEISQRFYLMGDESPISFADALRFLQSRWMEKKFKADRKLLLKRKEREAGNNSASVGRLLKKRLRPDPKSRRNEQ